MTAGCDALIAKPIHPSDLIERIAALRAESKDTDA